MKKSWYLILVIATYCFGMQRYEPRAMRVDLDKQQLKAMRVNLVEPVRKGKWLSQNRPESSLEAEDWINYFTSAKFVWKITSPEGATNFVMANFPTVTYPFWIKKIKCLFYELPRPGWQWTDTTVTFKIYADDGSTVLWYTSTEAQHYPTPTEVNLGADSVKIESGNFWVAFDPGDSTPTALSDSGAIRNRSYTGEAGSWRLLVPAGDTSRYEWSIYAYVAWIAGTEEGKMGSDIEVGFAPNPVKGYRSISYTIPTKTHVSITLYDITGRVVAVLQDGIQSPGKYEATIAPELVAGVYFCKFKAGEFNKTKKIVLL